MSEDADILIVGAGISGLVAAYELGKFDFKVSIVEGRDRVGGRIHSIENYFPVPVDAGAEFIHGDLPYTMKLVNEFNLIVHKKEGLLYKAEANEIKGANNFIDNYDLVLEKLNGLKSDVPFSEFINSHFLNEESMMRSLHRFANSFDLADPACLSSFGVRDELNKDGISTPYIFEKGYQDLIRNIHHGCGLNCVFHLSRIAKQIEWKRNFVRLKCINDISFTSKKIIVTVPLGVLLSDPQSLSNIKFIPEIEHKLHVAKQIGYGNVIKVILEFDSFFWKDQYYMKNRPLDNINFLLTDSSFPVWWSHKDNIPVLTGFTGGQNADKLIDLTNEEILDQSLVSLGSSLQVPLKDLTRSLIRYKVVNWSSDPFSLGGYSFQMLNSKKARKELSISLENTVFFAGEGASCGDSIGTVEAAIETGYNTARKIISSLNKV